MKNLPEKIYLDLGVDEESEFDFKYLEGVTWSEDYAGIYGVEYVRYDLAIDFALYLQDYGKLLGLDAIFSNFLKSRKGENDGSE